MKEEVNMSMIEVINLVGIPGSGKSTWAKTKIAKDPNNWLRINNDQIREMANGSIWSNDYEKIITETRNFMIREGLKRGKNIIIDNLNITRKHFDDVCKIVSGMNIDCKVWEKPFYVELEEAVERDSKRVGNACVGKNVIEKWWKSSGKTQFKFYKPRVEIFTKRPGASDKTFVPMIQDETKDRCVVFDNDGTISLIHANRSPYDASTADQDHRHEHVIEVMKLYHDAGYKILFVSGREEKDRDATERFYAKHFPEVKYELFMRPTGDMRKDVIIKKEIFEREIKGKYFCAGWYDDRLQIVKWLYEEGFPVFRVNNPESSF